MKVLMYVDAENINPQQLKGSLEKLNEYRGAYEVRGKFYGEKLQMGDNFNICISHGFEFIDTSNISLRRKNLADMKITVDAMDDVQSMGNVYKVFLVSNDVDFLPLVYKLTGFGILVDSFLCNSDNIEYSTRDIAKNLYSTGFLPINYDTCFTPVFGLLRKVYPENVSDSLLLEYLKERFTRFLNIVESSLKHKTAFSISVLDMHELSAELLCDVVLDNEESDSVCSYILTSYFQQVFCMVPAQKKVNAMISKAKERRMPGGFV